MPTRPKSTKPPQGLVELSKTFRHGDVIQTGVTTTDEGEWALLVRVRQGVATPLANVTASFPIVWQTERSTPVARPAYPAAGE
jgi:hypothetical protein